MVAECYLNQNDYGKAKTYLDHWVSLPDGGADKEKAFYLLGWIAYKEERFNDAILQFRSLLESYPSSSYRDESQYWIGWSYFRRRDYLHAIEEFQQLVLRYPESPFVPPSLLKMGTVITISNDILLPFKPIPGAERISKVKRGA